MMFGGAGGGDQAGALQWHRMFPASCAHRHTLSVLHTHFTAILERPISLMGTDMTDGPEVTRGSGLNMKSLPLILSSD